MERDPEADGATAGPRVRLDARELADGVWAGHGEESWVSVPLRPWRTPPADPLAAFWERQRASWERQRQLDYWVRRWVLLALLVIGAVLMVAATR